MAPDNRVLAVRDSEREEHGVRVEFGYLVRTGDPVPCWTTATLLALLYPDGRLVDYESEAELSVDFYRALASYFVDFDVL